MTDSELLQRYTRDDSESAFEELVRRHINLIYSAALRQMDGDSHLAQDVTQSVFTDLARKAAKLTRHTSLTGWLYTSTRFAAASLRRTEQRRRHREQKAHAMNTLFATTSAEPDWSHIKSLLDAAMHRLEERDREAVLLRYFRNLSYAEIGAGTGLSENAARMRVDRALEKLQSILSRQGVTSTAAVLGGLLTAHAVGAAPGQLASTMAKTALAGTATTGTAGFLAGMLALPKVKLAAGVLAIAGAAVLIAITATRSHAKTGVVATAAAAPATNAATASTANLPVAAPAAVTVNNPAVNEMKGFVLHLKIITADSGKPIPMVPIDYRAELGGVSGNPFQGGPLMSDRFGKCDVVYPTNVVMLQLITRKDYFADTKLLWHPSSGEVIPTNYVLRLDRAVSIGGTVVDADGHPVADARVNWHLPEDPATLKLPQNHDFGDIGTTTDQDGHWQINQIAEDVVARIWGAADHSNHAGTDLVYAHGDPAVEKALRAGTHVFKLGRAVTAKGVVTDANGTPIPEAAILVGGRYAAVKHTATSQSDGTFEVPGCNPGMQIVTAEAPGFAPAAVRVNLTDQTEPIHLTMMPGKTLNFRVVDQAGNPVPKADIWYNNNPGNPRQNVKTVPAQVNYKVKTDQDGRASLMNVPDQDMVFSAYAPGFFSSNGIRVRPNGQEQVITLSPALMMHGTVNDATTGQPIPKFRITLGWPERDIINDTTNAHWSSIARFWLDFNGGKYQHRFEEPMVMGMENRGYILKFMADGYAPFVTRTVAPNEGEVELNVILQRAASTTVYVYKPDGKPAAGVDIGLIIPGGQLALNHGGLTRRGIQGGISPRRTDAKGSFVLPADDSIIGVIAVSPDGYAEAAPAVLGNSQSMQLQPLGVLQVHYLSGGKPVTGREYHLGFAGELAGKLERNLSLDYAIACQTTDARGQLSYAQVPPGQYKLARVHSGTGMDQGAKMWLPDDGIPVTVRPGETTTISPGESNHLVTATLQWPAGMTRQTQWQVTATLHTQWAVPPPEIANDPAALRQFRQAAGENSHFCRADLQPDGGLSVDDVPPGDYEFSVSVYDPGSLKPLPASMGAGRMGMQPLAEGEIKVTVPANPPSGQIDAGVIQLQ